MLSLDLKAEQDLKPPELLLELGQAQWAQWLHHPVTDLLLRRFLPDYRRALERHTLDRWTNGHLTLNAEQEARGYLLVMKMIEDLTLDELKRWYLQDAGDPPATKRRP